jgi:hypothetical protein
MRHVGRDERSEPHQYVCGSRNTAGICPSASKRVGLAPLDPPYIFGIALFVQNSHLAISTPPAAASLSFTRHPPPLPPIYYLTLE